MIRERVNVVNGGCESREFSTRELSGSMVELKRDCDSMESSLQTKTRLGSTTATSPSFIVHSKGQKNVLESYRTD